jgi:hypothetical protein
MVIVTTATYEHLFEMSSEAHSIQRQIIWNIIAEIIQAT